MPKFHFYLVSANGREHVGSIELPSQNDLIPAGLRITTKILATIVGRHSEQGGLMVQSVDEAGSVVYNFDVSRGARDSDSPRGNLH
ncbi:hypothetical protein [Lichenibacterium dinghuense]|uniref:hypothetical protein n=1 Tax=Lichenibacterium dinghuense TaxID=2895977 RepID=UPI001F19B185|nr:hypothetical protein [Lichenibacterium sp. 6Y81]